MLKRTVRHPVTRLTVCYLVLFFAGAFTLPAVAEAAFISSSEGALAGAAPDTITQVQAALEDQYIIPGVVHHGDPGKALLSYGPGTGDDRGTD